MQAFIPFHEIHVNCSILYGERDNQIRRLKQQQRRDLRTNEENSNIVKHRHNSDQLISINIYSSQYTR